MFGLSVLIPVAAAAQSRLDCPRPVRERRYRIAPKPYLELSAGFSRPLLYRNAAGNAGENYSFVSRLTPYAAAMGYLPLSERFSVFGGLGITQTWQGLRFKYQDNDGAVELRSYAGATLLSVPFGLRYRSNERLQLSAGPYISYASHNGEESGTASGSVSGSSSGAYSFLAPDYKAFNFGLRLAADVAVTSALGVSLSCAADALGSASSSSTALGTRSTQTYAGKMIPYLWHAAFGISYRFPGRNTE